MTELGQFQLFLIVERADHQLVRLNLNHSIQSFYKFFLFFMTNCGHFPPPQMVFLAHSFLKVALLTVAVLCPAL